MKIVSIAVSKKKGTPKTPVEETTFQRTTASKAMPMPVRGTAR